MNTTATITCKIIDTDAHWVVTGTDGYATTIQLLRLEGGRVVGVELGSFDGERFYAWGEDGDLHAVTLTGCTYASKTEGRKILDHLVKMHSAA